MSTGLLPAIEDVRPAKRMCLYRSAWLPFDAFQPETMMRLDSFGRLTSSDGRHDVRVYLTPGTDLLYAPFGFYIGEGGEQRLSLSLEVEGPLRDFLMSLDDAAAKLYRDAGGEHEWRSLVRDADGLSMIRVKVGSYSSDIKLGDGDGKWVRLKDWSAFLESLDVNRRFVRARVKCVVEVKVYDFGQTAGLYLEATLLGLKPEAAEEEAF